MNRKGSGPRNVPRGPGGVMHRASVVAVVLALGAAMLAIMVLGSAGSGQAASPSGALAAQATVNSAIDQPAVARSIPSDAVVDVKAEFGAKGDGRSDDTAAIQAAVSAAIGLDNTRGVLYFPNGTYVIKKSIEWRRTDGAWATAITVQGQNRDRTVLRLANASPDFTNAAAPRAMLVTASQNADASGGGNQAFNNFIFDLTVDVGAGNPGAIGIDYLANNRGAIRNVVVRAADPSSGSIGIAMTRRWPGPALLEDVRIEGFGTGIAVGRSEYAMTFEDLRLSGQRIAGIANVSNVLSIRRLRSTNSVPAITSAGYPPGLVTVVESVLTGGAVGGPAIVNDGGALLRNVTYPRYSALIRHRGADQQLPASGVWTSDPPESLFGGNGAPLSLPVVENPDVPTVPLASMAGANAAGARGDDQVDDTAAIQAALDSGKPVVYLREGRYIVSRPLTVPSTVTAIVGFEAQIDATRGDFAGSSTAAVFSSRDDASTPLVLAQLIFKASPAVVDLERLGTRPVGMTDVHIGGLPFRGSPGQVVLTDVEGGQGWSFTAGQQVWGRHLNAEQPTTKVRSNGAQLWILGLKTESLGTVVDSVGGASTEILGGLLYPVSVVPDDTPAFAATDSRQSISIAVSAGQTDRNYRVLVEARRGVQTQRLTPADVPRRAMGSMIPLYSDAS